MCIKIAAIRRDSRPGRQAPAVDEIEVVLVLVLVRYWSVLKLEYADQGMVCGKSLWCCPQPSEERSASMRCDDLLGERVPLGNGAMVE